MDVYTGSLDYVVGVIMSEDVPDPATIRRVCENYCAIDLNCARRLAREAIYAMPSAASPSQRLAQAGANYDSLRQALERHTK